jgi:tetraacyldisaccharide 4'-kinase
MFAILTRFRNLLYDKKILSSVSVGTFVISIGNITWGGTGKTSLVKEITQFLMSKGFRVAIVSRGYGRTTSGPLLVQDGVELKCEWGESGEEAYLLAKSLPGAIVAVAENRSDGLHLVEGFSPDVILLDDAFQHRKVKRDLDIVLVDASEDVTSLKMIPFGKLREGPDSLTRSDAVVLTHIDEANRRTLDWMRDNMDRPVFHCSYVAVEPLVVYGKKIGAFCAIGAPDHFFRILRQEGAELVSIKTFRDHHAFTQKDLVDFRAEAKANGAEFLVTTAKDFVRVNPAWMDDFIKVLNVKLQIVEESVFFDFVLERLNQSRNRPSRLT